jgi:hypothetical protein
MKNYTFKKVDEKLTLDSPVWNDVEKATLDNDNFCGENAEKITVTAQGVCTKYGITVKFESDEKNPVIKYSHANQPAWTDSCVEFFLAPYPDEKGNYLNFEQSLGGALLLQKGPNAADRTYIPHSDEFFETEKHIDENGWKIKFFIPFSFIDKHFVTMNKKFRGNFQFCCEDKNVYLTWNRIENPFPAFHKPEYFGEMTLDMSVLDRMTAECIKYGYNVFEMCEMTENGVDDRTFLPSEPTHFSYSITKCVTSIIFGMLRDKGLVKETDKVANYLSEFFPEDVDPKWYDVTIENMLQHRNGGSGGGEWNKHIDTNEPNDKDFLFYIFSDKLPYEIGDKIVYCESNYYVISRIIEKIVGMPVDEWALKNLFNPLHFEYVSWGRCPQGHTFCGSGLSLRTRDMAKFGMIYANNGVYEGRRYLSEEWIKLATNVFKVDDFGGYGYAVQKTAYMKENEFYLVGAGDQTVVFRIGKPQVIAFHAAGAGGHLGLLKTVVDIMRED